MFKMKINDQYDDQQKTNSPIADTVAEMKAMRTRADYHRLSDKYNWRAYQKRLYKIVDRLTQKQANDYFFNKGSKDWNPISHIRSLTKSKVILADLNNLESFGLQVLFFRQNVNPNFMFSDKCTPPMREPFKSKVIKLGKAA